MLDLSQLPRYLLEAILLFLDIRQILLLLSLAKSMREEVFSTTLWRNLLIRDFPFFLLTTPLKFSDLSHQFRASELSVSTKPLESCLEYPPDYSLKLCLDDKQNLQEKLSKESIDSLISLYKYYSRKSKSSNFSGLWIGDYSSHGIESLRLFQRGFELFAIKITGDINVPARKMTWIVTMNEEFTYGRGLIHIADTGFNNPRWVPTEVRVQDQERLIVSSYFPHLNKWYKVSLGCRKVVTGAETIFMSIKLDEVHE